MTSRSERKDIYYLTVKVRYERHKRPVYREGWVITTHTTPADIMRHCTHCMSRLTREFYKKSKAKRKPVEIVEVLTMTKLGKTNHPG